MLDTIFDQVFLYGFIPVMIVIFIENILDNRNREKNPFDAVYHDLVKDILENGEERLDRTGTGVKSVFGRQLRFNLDKGFPLLTTKKMFFRGIVSELKWFLSGSTNVNDLPENTQKWWRPWAKEDGSLGPTYGHQFRNLKVDQLKKVIKSISEDPYSRRHIITLWNSEMEADMALPPCHGNHIQFYVSNGKLSCSMLQRSADVFIGLPVNIASYALLTHIIAEECDLTIGDLIININDAHIYRNHIQQCEEQLKRKSFKPPTINIEYCNALEGSIVVDLLNYKSHEAIKGDIAI